MDGPLFITSYFSTQHFTQFWNNVYLYNETRLLTVVFCSHAFCCIYYSVLWYESIIYTILGAIKKFLILPLLLELFSNEPMIICGFSCLALSVSLILSSFSFPTGCYVSRSSRCLFSNCCRVIQTMAGARKQDRWYNNNHCAYPRHGKCRCTKILNSASIKK